MLRYGVAVLALMAGLVLSIRWSERGVLLGSPGAEALAGSGVTGEAWDLESMRVFNQVLLQVRTNYVEPERVQPRRMLVRAIDRVQNSVPEVVALFNDDLSGDPTSVTVMVGDTSQVFDLSAVQTHWEMSFKLRDVFRFLQSHLDTAEHDLRDVEYAAVNGMLATLDPHSVLLTPRVYEDMQAANRGSFGGVGIVISIRDGQLTVISPMADTPAGRAGFRAGDRIVKINEESTVNMALDEAVSRLRGPAGTDVTVEIMRDGWLEPHSFVLTREIINIESVRHRALGQGIGYVEIRNFQGNTHTDLLQALRSLREEMGSLNGLVLDMRNDPGGLLQQAIRVADTFLSSGTIVTTVGIGNRLREQTAATTANTEPNYPIVVLVNAGTASASEIVAGALKVHNRAVVVGDITFGKGSVQNIYPFRDGSALKLTIAQYLTAGDISIQGVGIVPDIQIVPARITDEMIDIFPGEQVLREGDLDTSLTSERLRDRGERPGAHVRYFVEPEETDVNAVVDPDDFVVDFEIDFARQLLTAVGSTAERTAMLVRGGPTVERVNQQQDLIIQEQLRRRNVDWAAGPNVIQPVTLTVTTDRRNNRLDAGERLTVTVNARNDGDRPLHRVRAVSRSDYHLLNDREFVFGRIAPGQSRSWSVDLDVPVEDPSRHDLVTFNAWADTIELGSQVDTIIQISGQPRPHWGFSWWIDDVEGGNGDGQLQVGESVTFHVLLRNTGAGDARETVAAIRNGSDSAVFLTAGRETIGTVAADGWHLASFRFDVRERPEEGFVKLDVEIVDTVFREYLSEPLEVPVGPAGSGVASRPFDGSLVVSAASAPIHPAPLASSERIADLSRGAVLRVDRRRDGWVRARWGDGRSGWVPEAAVQVHERELPAAGAVSELLQFQAPIIELEQGTLAVNTPTFTLRGIVSDESAVRDYYIIVTSRVSNNRRESAKRVYRRVNARTATIDEVLPLQPGNNQITVVARDDDRIETTTHLHVLRRE